MRDVLAGGVLIRAGSPLQLRNPMPRRRGSRLVRNRSRAAPRDLGAKLGLFVPVQPTARPSLYVH